MSFQNATSAAAAAAAVAARMMLDGQMLIASQKHGSASWVMSVA